MQRILVTGANGQLGQVLCAQLAKQQFVIATDIRQGQLNHLPIHALDILNAPAIEDYLRTHQITHVYHLAALLSAKGEQNPELTWQVNTQGLINVLEAIKRVDKNICLFFPSTIAVYGNIATYCANKKVNQLTNPVPQTMYGISKIAGEHWCAYFAKNYGIKSYILRFPGIIGWQSKAGGGTTDYAVEIFQALNYQKHYTCFLPANQALPMMYMQDAIDAIIQIMSAQHAQIAFPYLIAGCSFTPEVLAAEIMLQLGQPCTINYLPDFRADIAKQWPNEVDDAQALTDWGWQAQFTLKNLVTEMLLHV